MSEATNGTPQNADYLLGRVGALERENGAVKQESIKRKKALRELQAEHDRLKSERDALAAERDQLKTQKAPPAEGWQAKYEALARENRTRDHRDAFAATVAPLLNDKVTVDKLWAEIGYEPGDELPTPEQIAEHVGKAKEAAPYLFREAGGKPEVGPDGPQRASRPPLRETIDAGRGAPDRSTSRVTIRQRDLQSPVWCSDPRNKKLIAEASAAGTLTIVDD